MARLDEYGRKRNFLRTTEPPPSKVVRRKHSGIFVVQLHHARRRHYDFRLESDGVLKSWAIPKGPSFDPSVKRLAVEVEDHPISYASFEGDIPDGSYGAGHVDIFDSGTWEPMGNVADSLARGELKFTLNGDVLRGSWVLVRTRKQGSKQQWLLIKHRDEFAGSAEADSFVDKKTDRPLTGQKSAGRSRTGTRKPARDGRVNSVVSAQPQGAKRESLRNVAFAPELSKAQDAPPPGEGWLHEMKWDGYRILATVVDGKVRLWSRNAIEWTGKIPELAAAVKSLKLKSAQLDGEMIVMRDGRDDFNALQGRLSAENRAPAIYMLFDVPYLNGFSLRAVALLERKALLAKLLANKPHPLLRFSEHQIGNGKGIFAQAMTAGVEGVVSKRVDSSYEGSRNGDWVKAKARLSDEFVVAGYTEPKGTRPGIGALLLAKPLQGKLVYVGRVGSGFGSRQLRELRQQLAATRIDQASVYFDLMSQADRKLAIWVKPKMIVEVFYRGIGGKGLLRQAAFKAIREDKSLRQMMRDEGGEKMKNADEKRLIGNASRRVASAAKPSRPNEESLVISHPDREVFPGSGITKSDVADYYCGVADLLLTQIQGRPLSVVRCPGGVGKACFFQKHISTGMGKHVHSAALKEKGLKQHYLYIDDQSGLLELVQMNVLELHPWGSTIEAPDLADRIVFDLDPHSTVTWSRVKAGARTLRMHLESIGLACFLRTSGGKGMHVVMPLNPPCPWEKVKAFAHAVAETMVSLQPKEFVSVAGEKNRRGKIFIDWLRNGRGATSVASYSLRARKQAGVAMPLEWSELGRLKSGDAYTIKNALKKISARAKDPWREIDRIEQSLPEF